ncbi:PAS domain S-box protein [Candidatus Fermentibacteria bacterium]|nr:PAS domain S-box protein [Candidatus Fermentibacteria bacterium]
MRRPAGAPSPAVRLPRVTGLGALILIIGLALSTAAVFLVTRRADRELRLALVRQARLAAYALSFERLAALTGTDDDLTSPDYLRIKAQLAGMRIADPRCRFLYLMGRRADGSVFFLVDSEPFGSADESPPGQTYDEASPQLHRVFTTMRETVVGPFSDRWGTWISAFVPLARDNGNVVVFGMDIAASGWRGMVAASAAVPALLALLTAGLSLAVIRLRRITQHARANAQKVASIFRGSPIGVGVAVNRIIVEVNDRFCELCGYAREELIGQSTARLYPHDKEYERVGRDLYEPINRGAIGTVEAKFRRRDGGLRDMALRAAALDPRHPEFGVALAAVDITERKRGEDALRHSHSLIEATLESTADGILVVDRAGKIAGFNRRFLELWRIPKPLAAKGDDEALLRFVLDQLEDPGAFLDKVHALYGMPEAVSTDEVRFKDGRVFERYSQPQRVGDEVAGRVWSFRDITERMQTAEALRAAVAEKDVLLREVHHRVKNALQGIIALVGLRIAKISDESVVRSLEELQEQARAMALVYERLYQSSDVTQVDMEPYLEAICRGLVEAFRGDRDLAVTVHAPSVRLPVTQAMPCGLIVNELVSNALKHAFPPEVRPFGGIQVAMERVGDGVVLSVSDDGVGPPEGFTLGGEHDSGLQLVRLWATHQLGGSIESIGGAGLRVTVRFEAERVAAES